MTKKNTKLRRCLFVIEIKNERKKFQMTILGILINLSLWILDHRRKWNVQSKIIFHKFFSRIITSFKCWNFILHFSKKCIIHISHQQSSREKTFLLIVQWCQMSVPRRKRMKFIYCVNTMDEIKVKFEGVLRVLKSRSNWETWDTHSNDTLHLFILWFCPLNVNIWCCCDVGVKIESHFSPRFLRWRKTEKQKINCRQSIFEMVKKIKI